jgi:hypothetical protein
MIIGILRAIGVVVSTLSTILYSAIDISEPYTSTIDPANRSLKSWLRYGAVVSSSTLRTENVSL